MANILLTQYYNELIKVQYLYATLNPLLLEYYNSELTMENYYRVLVLLQQILTQLICSLENIILFESTYKLNVYVWQNHSDAIQFAKNYLSNIQTETQGYLLCRSLKIE
jgi:hypothetical protein